MGVATYHHGDLRRALLAAVAEQVDEGGVAAVSLRDTARRAGVSHAAPAHHFRDKRALLTEFALQGQRLLAATLEDTEARGPTTGGQVAALGIAYARFAVTHPAHFEVMSRIDVIDDDDPALRAVAQPNFDRLHDAVVAHQEASGWRSGWDPDRLAVMIWAQVHGLAQLWLGGFVAPHLRAGGIGAFAEDMLTVGLGLPTRSPGQP